MTNSAIAFRSRASTAWANAQSLSAMAAGGGKQLVSSYESREKGKSPRRSQFFAMGGFSGKGRRSRVEGMRIVASLVLTCGLIMGQEPGMGGGPMSPEEREKMMLDSLSDQLCSKKDQQEQLKTVIDRGKENVHPLQPDSIRVKGKIRAAVKNGADATPLYEKYGAAQPQLAAAEAMGFADVLPMLMAPLQQRRGR
jgi:hypothetical protein